MIPLFMALISLIVPVTTIAQTQTGYFVGGLAATALITDEVLTNSAAGLQLGYRYPAGLLFLVDFLYAGDDYYYFDFDQRRWTQAASWSEVPNGDISRSAWPFYRSRSLLGGAIGYSADGYPLGYFASLGFMISMIQESDATGDYPGFKDAIRSTNVGSSPIALSTSLRLGATFPVWGPLTGQLAYMLLIGEEWNAFEQRFVQFRRNSMIMLGLVVNTGIY
jgi:hypothetical protein